MMSRATKPGGTAHLRACVTLAFMLALIGVGALGLPRAEAAALLPPSTLSTSAAAVGGAARVDVDASGDATAVWFAETSGTQTVVQTSTHAAGSAWSSPQDISFPGSVTGQPSLAVDAAGDAAVAWLQSNGSNYLVEVASKPALGSWSLPATVSASGEDADTALIALDGTGDVYVAWDRSDGTHDRVQAVVQSGGYWGPTQTLSASNVSGTSTT